MTMRHLFMVSAIAATVVACSADSTGPRAGTGGLQLRVTQTASSAATLIAAASLEDAPMPAVVRGQVTSVEVTLTAVHALRMGANEDDESAWVRIPISPAQTIDLLNLPTTSDAPLLLPRGDLPIGAYRNLRLIVENATVTFGETVTVGPRTWAANTPHPVRIPGPSETRLKVPTARFDVGEANGNGELIFIDLVFDPSTSVRQITATPNFLLMAPVLQATPRR
jgi:hypothetical protein